MLIYVEMGKLLEGTELDKRTDFDFESWAYALAIYGIFPLVVSHDGKLLSDPNIVVTVERLLASGVTVRGVLSDDGKVLLPCWKIDPGIDPHAVSMFLSGGIDYRLITRYKAPIMLEHIERLLVEAPDYLRTLSFALSDIGLQDDPEPEPTLRPKPGVRELLLDRNMSADPTQHLWAKWGSASRDRSYDGVHFFTDDYRLAHVEFITPLSDEGARMHVCIL